ncbi:MAG: hypothetical protein M1484_02275 [Patescibacteria group bacterium]|nr:hypothetical protein [Patescibacteria group bacterium]
MVKPVVPADSRYIPLTQQPACCVPTCIQMIMYRHNIPLIPAEELGYHLGLIVHPDRKRLFHNVRTSTKKPAGGYGTRIYKLAFEPNTAFKKLGIPLTFALKPITQFRSKDELYRYLQTMEERDKDVLLCFHHGALVDDPSKDWGHLCVFDRLVENKIRLIDPGYEAPKWRLVSMQKMFEAMRKHGVKQAAGCWEIELSH